jgi:TonB C terminal
MAAAGALALHALLLVALMLLPRAKVVAPSRPKTLQVDLRRVSPPGAPTATALPEEKHARGAVPARKAAPPARATEPPAGTGATEPPAGTGATAESKPAPWSRDWQVGEGLERPRGDLSLRLDHPEDVRGRDGGVEDDGSAGLVREKSREEKLAEEQATVQRRVEGWLSDTKAKGRAQSRDGYWQPIEDALGRGFNPGWDVLEHGPDKGPNSTLGGLAEAWKKQAAAYGRSGNPFAGQPDAPGARKPLHEEFVGLPNEDRGLPSNLSLAPALNVGMLSAAASASGNAWHFRLVASVRIIQRQDGSLLAVELLGKSGNAAYDRLVLGQARSLGALRLGPPKQGLETLWAFETDFSQIPPLPIVGCALDDFIPKNCWRPLQKLVRSRVRLQAIY